ncbi:unnamed protein product, partial [marine sediment metagenome]
MGKFILLRPQVFRANLLELVRKEFKKKGGNTAQICRIKHGAKHRYDIKYCRENPYHKFRDANGFKERGNNCLYENCKTCNPGYGRIYYHLGALEKKGYLESRMEYRGDPIVTGAKDWMRMWY